MPVLERSLAEQEGARGLLPGHHADRLHRQRESQALADLFTGPARTWSLAAGLLQPVYGAGQIAAVVDLYIAMGG